RDEVRPGREVPAPALPKVQSRVAVPALALGQLVGVVMVESDEMVAFTEVDEAVLTIVASMVANAIEVERARERTADAVATSTDASTTAVDANAPTTQVRFF